MIKKILVGLLAFAGIASNAQNSLLWKISGNGLSAPSYLYGTIHITCDATLDAATRSAMDKTQQLYLELDMDDESMMTGESMPVISPRSMKRLSWLSSSAS